jgi:AraC-like DNA-binding protein
MSSHHGVPGNSTRSFVDPDEYVSAIRGGGLCTLLGRGAFRAEVTSIEAGRLMLQRGRENLPRLASIGMPPTKVGIVVWLGDSQLPVIRGVQMHRGELMCLGLGMESHHRTFGPDDFVALTLDASDLTRAAIDLAGCELTVRAGKVMRPPDRLRARLLSVVEAATCVARTTPGIFTSPQAAAALEQALLRPMIMCLLNGEARTEGLPRGRRAAIAKRFEAAVEANFDRPLLIPDLCQIVGVPGRTLRTLCQEQLGMSPQRFLALRRLHLARRALLQSDPNSTTVTEIVSSHGVWELGRFAVSYKSLFGESPSATLRRPPDMMRAEKFPPLETEPNLHSAAIQAHL